MTICDVPHIAQHLLGKYGLTAQGWWFAWDHARRRAGCCRHRLKLITLSLHYVALNLAERPEDIVDTILHEIAHAMAGLKAGHGPDWKAACSQVGAIPRRCYDSSVISMPRGRYRAVCGGCGKEFRRHKRERVGTWRHCTKCGPERGRLMYHDTTTLPIKDATPLAPKRIGN